ncbi:hypothetical protein A8C56_10150 [Niabella ginsenosidivorans]|uniref:Outer membrane protein beta-barrel domain-containing protein n=1 Tax=Niabella ginsenosidivorans TaxID=1176587 RepID=A0A1A9I0Z5_9BACT|nr:hypothetical protein A8C56_10150 [Niabella ginsenosidivorans]
MFILIAPLTVIAQQERKGWYAALGPGYGSYTLDLYNYNGGASSYADQHFTEPVIWLGIEKKSVLQRSRFILDAGGELTGGFALSTRSTVSGPSADKKSNGWSLGVHGLVKAGYTLGTQHIIVPLLGAGPYFISLQTGSGDEGYSSRIYGAQGYAGVDFVLKRITVTPQVHFGIASWGNSDKQIGKADNTQNGQPSMLEAGIKVALKL